MKQVDPEARPSIAEVPHAVKDEILTEIDISNIIG